MSRSYKHTPYCGDRKTRWAKRYANKRVRNYFKKFKIEDECLSHSYYKKISQSWNICDYYSIFTLNEWLDWKFEKREWIKNGYNEERAISEWYKWYIRK